VCGGCQLQHLDYPAQAEAKGRQVEAILRRIGGLEVDVEPILAARESYEYRNKMEYSFGEARWLEPHELDGPGGLDRFALGLHVPGRHDRILNISRCHLQSDAGSAVVRTVRELAAAGGLPAYSTRTHRGFWRFLVVREGANTGERMVHLITAGAAPGSREWNAVETVAAALRARDFGITSLLHGMTDAKASVAVAERVRTLFGEPVIRETLLGFTFTVGPGTFFQTNTAQAERLFRAVLERGRFEPGQRVWDLYCGVGAITLPVARLVGSVHGVEAVPEAVEAARGNAAANGVGNATFATGDLKDGLPEGDHPDAVVLDPPRTGVHPKALARLADLAPPRIVYVSCNPTTLARDLGVLAGSGYAVESVLPVDMFPHTGHVECVAALSRARMSA
jgi:23S rRNA (uracil1939-C5)-methyltransferase